jgi:hypothetical protein
VIGYRLFFNRVFSLVNIIGAQHHLYKLTWDHNPPADYRKAVDAEDQVSGTGNVSVNVSLLDVSRSRDFEPAIFSGSCIIAMGKGQGFAGYNGYLGFRRRRGQPGSARGFQRWRMAYGDRGLDSQNDGAGFYVDGELLDNQTGIEYPDLQDQPIVIRDEIGSDRQRKAEIAHYMIIDPPLTEEEVEQFCFQGVNVEFSAEYGTESVKTRG